MFASILRLRKDGRRLSHVVEARDRMPPDLLIGGILELGTSTGLGRGRWMMVRSAMSAPGCGLLAALYEPRITGTTDDALVVRGLEEVGNAVCLQEWAIYLR